MSKGVYDPVEMLGCFMISLSQANAYCTVLQKQKTKMTTNFCFCNTPSFQCYGKTKTKAQSFGHFRSSKPVIMPLTGVATMALSPFSHCLCFQHPTLPLNDFFPLYCS
jgi:hypothetical protein